MSSVNPMSFGFDYFAGPPEHMSDLVSDKGTVCYLCGAAGPCFRLGFSICPELTDAQRESAAGCVSCLRAGRYEFRHDTEIGLLDENGLSHVYNHNQTPPADFPSSALVELRRTPQIATWQQELWLAHCNDFMSYQGTWEPADFYANAPDGDGKALFLSMTDAHYEHLWEESLPEGADRLESWYATYYVFRCLHCGKLRGNWDCD